MKLDILVYFFLFFSFLLLFLLYLTWEGSYYENIYILCIVNHEMPWYFLSWVLGSDIYLYQETLYQSESCKRKLRRTSPCGPQGMATQVRPTYRQHYSCYAIACRSTWLLSSALSPPLFRKMIMLCNGNVKTLFALGNYLEITSKKKKK